MPKYLLLLQHPVGAHNAISPDQMQDIVSRYRQWVSRLRDSGAFIASEKLANDGRTLRGINDRLRVSDGPYVEGKELIAGFYLIEARDYDHAVELAKECPALEHGLIEVRQILEK